MSTAACVWPVEDTEVPLSRAIGAATLDLPRVLAENHWMQFGLPTGWRVEEGVGEHGPALFLRCEVQVLVMPHDRREAG